jgi:hypothetical protein
VLVVFPTFGAEEEYPCSINNNHEKDIVLLIDVKISMVGLPVFCLMILLDTLNNKVYPLFLLSFRKKGGKSAGIFRI